MPPATPVDITSRCAQIETRLKKQQKLLDAMSSSLPDGGARLAKSVENLQQHLTALDSGQPMLTGNASADPATKDLRVPPPPHHHHHPPTQPKDAR